MHPEIKENLEIVFELRTSQKYLNKFTNVTEITNHKTFKKLYSIFVDVFGITDKSKTPK